MTPIIVFFGLLIFLAGIIIVINPDTIFGVLRNNLEKVSLHVLAVGVRVVIGILLILSASASKYPTIIAILGWLSLVAAATLFVIGRRRFLRLMCWALSLPQPYSRISGLVAMAFGGFLVHAFL
jgi:hypothetical protein